MARAGSQDRERESPAAAQLLEHDLAQWAGAGIAAGGRKDALLGRVESLRLTPDGRRVEARVRGNRPLPYQVRVWVVDGGLDCRCTCARETKSGCKHAVAALEALRFPAAAVPRVPAAERRGRPRAPAEPPPTELSGYWIVGGAERTFGRDERIELARAEELATRRVGARRRGLTVEPLEGTVPGFCVSRKGARHGETVALWGEKFARGSCTCADHWHGELGTCVHVERARMWFSRKPKPDLSRVCTVRRCGRASMEHAPDRLSEIRLDAPGEGTPPSLEGWFDETGWLRTDDDGALGPERAQAAVDAARRLAADNDWLWDLDPAVPQRIELAAQERRGAERLSSIGPGHPDWEALVPKLGLRLHAYQETGVAFLARRGRAFLADDMGLGKTVQAIAAAGLLQRAAGVRRMMVVCPASLKHQWKREIDKATGEAAHVVEGPRSRRLRAYAEWTDGFMLINYELVLRDLDAIRETDVDLVILDEAQRIKNWDTKTARAVKRLRSPYAFILTGTPLENRLHELHSLVEYIHPRGLGPRWRLLPFHAVTDGKGRILAYEGLQVLRRRLRPFFLRRERDTVLDQLPERTDHTFWTGMTAAQRAPYRKHASTVGALASRGQPLGPREVRVLLQSLTCMRILCNSRAQYAWDTIEGRLTDPAPPSRGELRALGSPKLEEFARVLDDLLDESDAKVVVFSQWERMLRLAGFVTRDVLERRDLRADVFHGGLSSKARDEMLDSFFTDPDFRVLYSTDAGGLGLNLQEAASVVVNLEVPWNPAVLEQRIGRVHRMGQRRGVRVLHFVTRGALEERVRQILEGKRALFDGLLTDDVDRVVFDDAMRGSLVERVLDLIESSQTSASTET
ncbi:MAG: DEAD/DEAH box helicase [bacterium]|nr:DEAD/DEAH box helicase [bacterium]